ncbi:MAG: ABC transporter permease [Acholeplasmatales bacterium]|nr:MAG: ABC transporter permease [Acholeplasmatales bacterium]
MVASPPLIPYKTCGRSLKTMILRPCSSTWSVKARRCAMHSFWQIFKKEMVRVLTDRRLVLMVFIVPGLSIYILYSLMGMMIANQLEGVQEHRIVLYEANMPDAFRSRLLARDEANDRQRLNLDIRALEDIDEDTMTAQLLSGDIDVVMIFDPLFMDAINDADNHAIPEVFIHYNYGRQQSSFGYNQVTQVLMAFREDILIDRLESPEQYLVFMTQTAPVVDERQLTGQGIAVLMPMLIIIFLFAGAMSIGPDAIAGEKERGTIATLLVTPIKRSEIAIGKVTSLAALALISALSSFIGILLSLPRLMQLEEGNTNLGIYGVSEYGAILLVLASTVLFITGLVAVVSAYAKTVKEASMLIMPFYFITLLVGLVSSFGQDPIQMPIVHIIPLYGPVNLLSGIFIFEWSMINLLIVIVSSLLYTALFIWALARMFNSEKVMFQR